MLGTILADLLAVATVVLLGLPSSTLNDCPLYMLNSDSVNYPVNKTLQAAPTGVKAINSENRQSRKIPYNIFQTNEEERLPAGMVETMMHIIEVNNDHDYHYYSANRRE
jgi:hypothetical protein